MSTLTSDPVSGHGSREIQSTLAADGPSPVGSQATSDTHTRFASGGPIPIDTVSGQRCFEAHSSDAADGPNIDTGQRPSGVQRIPAGVEQSPSGRAKHGATPIERPLGLRAPNIDISQSACNAHARPADIEQSPAPTPRSLDLEDASLVLAADLLDSVEATLNANRNRLRQATRAEEDKDGRQRGLGLSGVEGDPRYSATVAVLAQAVSELEKLEHQATLSLARAMRKHPLGPWMKAQKGVGEKQAARLLAAVRDPYWNDLHDRPRTVSELWSFCGYGDANQQVRRAGRKATWSPTAKMRAYLIAAQCLRYDGHYRDVYDAERAKIDGSAHPKQCVRCGPSGRPAAAGSPRSKGHLMAMALRKVSKEFLRDMWVESKRLHEEAGTNSV